MKSLKVAIIGSGIAGLASAIRLRAKGYDATVFESNPGPGGKNTSTGNGRYRFDAGPSLFTLPHLVDELFETAGENPREHFRYTRLPEVCRYFFPSGTRYTAPADPGEFISSFSQTFHEAPGAVERHLKRSEWLYKITAPIFLEKSLNRISTYTGKTGLRGILSLPLIGPFTSMHSANRRRFRNPESVQFFDRYATYNGSDPYRAPSTLNVIPHLEIAGGAWYPEGGMISISDSLYRLALRQGVQFRFNTRVTAIQHNSGKVSGIQVNNESTIEFDRIVCNMDVYPAYEKLLPGIPMPRRIQQAESSGSALIFYWGIRGNFEELGLHNIFFSADYQKEFETLFRQRSITDDPTVYINITSKMTPGDAPAGCENWFVMVNAPADTGQDWPKLIAETRKNILNKLRDILGRDIEKLIDFEEMLTPELIRLRTSSHRGALYGSSSNHILSAFFRHRNDSAKLKGLYFAGGSVHPGGGIPLCLLSAKISASLLSEDQP